MQSYYDFVSTHPEGFIQFSCKGILFLKMECPPDFIKGEDWSIHNCILHVLSGKKRLSSREYNFELQKGDTIFLKKGAITIERLGAELFCALMFYVPDQYIRSFMKEQAVGLHNQKISSLADDRAFPIRNTPVLSAFYDSVIPYFSTPQKPAENLLNRYKSEFAMLEIPGFVQKAIFPLVLFFGKLTGKDKKFADAPPPVKS